MRTRKRFLAALICAVFLACAAPLETLAASPAEDAWWLVDDGGFPVSAEEVLADATWLGIECALRAGQSEVAGQTTVCTGQTLVMQDLMTGEDIGEVPVVVRGDVTGTGEASLSQVARIGQALTGDNPLDGIWLAAGDLDGSGTIDLTDMLEALDEYRTVSADESDDMQMQVYPVLLGEISLQIPLYFAGDERDIPYVATRTMEHIFDGLSRDVDSQGVLLTPSGDGSVVFEQPNGSTATLDFESDTIAFSDYNRFFSSLDASASLDSFSDFVMDPDTENRYIKRASGSFERPGLPSMVDVGSYGIEMPWHGRTGYVPLQTFSDLFMPTPFGVPILYNGEVVQLAMDMDWDLYYEAAPRPRSAELASFTYNELCLALDYLYGLKREHNIQSFDALVRQTGLRSALLSTDAAAADRAMCELLDTYLGDMHSAVVASSFYAGEDSLVIDPADYSAAITADLYKMLAFSEARDAAYPDGIPFYEEVGDTAFVTLDEFITDANADYYAVSPDDSVLDTIGIIGYAHSRITRPGSPVRNVVLDLSNNGGGEVNAAIYVLGWLQGTASICFDSTVSMAQATMKYRSDVNFDGKYDTLDTVASRNCYCLISPSSFSCANLVPASLKGSTVTLLGQTTGGGACLVQELSAADGTLLQISGPTRACTLQNGAYYEADRGIEPDFRIAHPRNYYDRPALVEYIHGLSA